MSVPAPPPKVVRRVVVPLLLLVGLVVAVVLLPVLVVLAALSSAVMTGHWRALRLLGLALTYLVLELAGAVAAAALWVAAGCGTRLDRPRWQAAHYRVLHGLLAAMVAACLRLFALRLVDDGPSWSPLDDGVPGSTAPMIVLSRHAGPGDSLLLVRTLMNRDHLRRPHVVLKSFLQWDPMVDLYLNRLPSTFVPGGGEAVQQAVGRLAEGLSEEDALLIFPEGGNVTPARRESALRKLREAGYLAAAEQAAELQHVLPARPGGVRAALQAAPGCDVVFVGHTGLEHLSSGRDIWAGIPDHKTLLMRWWFVPGSEVPADPDDLPAWLNEWWARVDDWIAEELGGRVTPDDRHVAGPES